MNNEEKRFKQINRIAKPIQVNQSTNNDNKEQPVNNTPKQASSRSKKKITKETILITIIILLSILCIVALIYLIIISSPKNNQTSLKYKDATTSSTTKIDEAHFIKYEVLSESEKIDYATVFNLSNFNISLNASGNNFDIIVNGKNITSANYLISKVGFVDDLIMLVTGNNEVRTTNFYVIDESGNIIYDIYNYSDIDGMVLNDSNAVNYNPNSIIFSMSRVNNNRIYNSNKKGNNTSFNLCDEESLYQNSIELKNPARINYSLEYLGNHKFSQPLIIYEESIEDYKSNNNLCN